MIAKTMGVVWLVLAVGCVAPEAEPEETSEVEQHVICPGSGLNGNRQGWWNTAFTALARPALQSTDPALDLWDGGKASPMSLCDPATLTDYSCTARSGWLAWLDVYPATHRRGIFMEIVRVALPKGYRVWANGTRYDGTFGLYPSARVSSWGQEGREIVSAGLLALLNAVPDIPLCLNSRQMPNNCAGSTATYQESITFGDIIVGGPPRIIAIHGGVDAKDPTLNPRYGSVDQESAFPHHWNQHLCQTTGTGAGRYPTGCTRNGTSWTNPVQVLVPGPPDRLYYDDPIGNHRYDPSSWDPLPL